MDQEDRLRDTGPVSVSAIEYSVLNCIRLEGGLITLDDIGTLANAIRRHQPGDDTDYATATASCLSRGWIKIITEQDQREDIARWANEPHQSLSENPYRAGAYDLTPLGWQVFARQVEEQYGYNLEMQCAEGVHYLWDVPGWVSFLSTSEGALIQELENVLSGTDDLTFSEEGCGLQAQHILGQMLGPYPIGSWWVNRFYRAPAGYRLDIAFEPADLHTTVSGYEVT